MDLCHIFFGLRNNECFRYVWIKPIMFGSNNYKLVFQILTQCKCLQVRINEQIQQINLRIRGQKAC